MNALIIEGVMELLALITGGVIVGWITSTFFARKAADAEVGGYVMKRKLAVYEELYRRLESMTDQEIMPGPIREDALKMLRKNGFEVRNVPQNPTMKIFGSARKLTDAYLDADSYISSHRIYFSDVLYDRMLIFTNYFAVFRRLLVVYEEQFVSEGYSLSDSSVSGVEDSMALQLGLLFQEEFAEEIKEVLYVLRREVSSLELKRKKKRDHSSKELGDEGRITKMLMKRKIFVERDKVMTLIMDNVVMGMRAVLKK